jgi:DNA modification methylase
VNIEMPTDENPAVLLLGDVLDNLRRLPDSCVHCCVTSPPYWSLRDYGVDGQIGLESTPEAFIAKLVDVFREVRRVLHPSGICAVNMGDSYNAGNSTSSTRRPQSVPCGTSRIARG